MGPDNGPVGLCRLQFGGEALRPDGLLGVVLPNFVFLVKKLADELHGALGNARERGPLRTRRARGRGSVVTVQKLKIRTKRECRDRR